MQVYHLLEQDVKEIRVVNGIQFGLEIEEKVSPELLLLPHKAVNLL